MTTTTRRPSAPEVESPERTPQVGLAAALAAITFVLALTALLMPNLAADAGGDGMPMTHYMGLLAANQPWNLLIFMAVPVILAETLAITELVILFGGHVPPIVRSLSRWAGLIVGPVMVAITLHLLLNAVLPLTMGGAWRGPADAIAVLAYLLGTIPLVGITLVELRLIGRTERHALKLHATFVGIFLVVAHVAMIFGMLDPTVLGWVDMSQWPAHQMPDGSLMTPGR